MALDWRFAREDVHSHVDIRGFVDGQKNAAKELNAADLVAREVIQNSWDAFRLDVPKGVTRAPRLSVSFRFVRLEGSQKKDFLDALSWEELCALRGSAVSDEPRTGAYEEIRDSDSLTILVASDRGGPGLYQDFSDPRGNWISALTKLNGGRTDGPGGGSYGVGKTAFISAGSVPVIAAYTCFAAGAAAGHTRRGQAIAYWWNFLDGATPRVGLGWLTAGDEATVPPVLDEQADDWAAKIGLTIRDPRAPEQTGLDLVIIEPNFDVATLVASIETYWWPALVNGDFDVSVEDADHNSIPIDPFDREDLAPFIETFQVLLGPSSKHPQPASDHKWEERAIEGVKLGECLLRAVRTPPDSPSPGDDMPDLSGHRVAMIRSAHMVLWYYKPRNMPANRPAIQGTYLMESDEGSRLLRAAEPGFHDYWVTSEKSAKGAQLKSIKFAAAVQHDVNAHAREVWAKTAGATDSEDASCPMARDILNKLLAVGEKPGPGKRPPKGTLEVAIGRGNRKLGLSGADSVVSEGSFTVAPRGADDPKKGVEVEIRLSARVVLGRTSEGEKIGISITEIPPGFKQASGESSRLRGRLKEAVKVVYRTDPYPQEYVLKAECEVTAT